MDALKCGCLLLLFLFCAKECVAQNCSNFATAPSDLTNETAIIDYIKLNVTCSITGVHVIMSRCALIELGYSGNVSLFDSSGIHIKNSSCTPTAIENNTEIEFSFGNFSVCSSAFQDDGLEITYTYDIKNEEHPVPSLIITRDFLFSVQFTCVFQSSYNVTYATGISAVKKTVNVTAGASSGSFGEQFLLYNDSSFASAYNESVTSTISVVVPSRIHFEITATGADPTQYILRASDCWLTPTSSSTDSTNYYIMTSGCEVADATYSDANIIYLNNNSTSMRMGFRSFVWSTGQTSLHIHCDYKLCDFVANATCSTSPTCSGKRRRRDLMSRNNDQSGGRVVTYGPIRVVAPPTACDVQNGGCAYRCVPWSENQVICVCPDGYKLNSDGRTCRHLSKLGIDLNPPSQPRGNTRFTVLGVEVTDLEIVTYTTLALSTVLLLAILLGMARSRYCKRKADKINYVYSPDY